MFRKLLNDTIYNLIFNQWGTSKTFKVIGITITCGAIGSVIGASVIENNPENKQLEKEND